MLRGRVVQLYLPCSGSSREATHRESPRETTSRESTPWETNPRESTPWETTRGEAARDTRGGTSREGPGGVPAAAVWQPVDGRHNWWTQTPCRPCELLASPPLPAWLSEGSPPVLRLALDGEDAV